MSYFRNFPRYKVSKLKGKILFPGVSPEQITLDDISLGGIQIRSENKLITKEEMQVEVQFLNESYHLVLKQVWLEEAEDDIPFKSGFKIIHQEIKELNKWIKLLKAMHLLKQKRSKRDDA